VPGFAIAWSLWLSGSRLCPIRTLGESVLTVTTWQWVFERTVGVLFLVCCTFSAAIAQDFSDDPELLIEEIEQVKAKADTFMVSSADALATEAGLDILRAGGTAVDAAIAVQMVLGLVEPQSSGIGGGAFLVHYDAEAQSLETYDGREWAPKAATPNLFLKADGKFMGWGQAFASGRSTGVPGVLRMLELAHQDHGRLPWADLFQSAIELADNGFLVSNRLAETIARMKGSLSRSPDTASYFFETDGVSLAKGHLLKNKDYADTLRLLAADGADAFYSGAIADAIRDRIGQAIASSDMADYAGITRQDLEEYRAVKREPVCGAYRIYQVCGMGPPSSGGVTVLQILTQLEPFDIGTMGPKSPMAVHLFAEASRRAFADRNLYLADPDQVEMPLPGMLDRSYLFDRAATISLNRVTAQEVEAGTPDWSGLPRAENLGQEGRDTTHFSIIDRDGNVVSMTSSVETVFGSRLMTKGFILNNQLTDFSFFPEKDGKPIANAPNSRKRPRSSMSPSIVFNSDGDVRMVIGSPGGSNIIGFVAKTIVAHLDWGLNIQEAIDYPHIINRNGVTTLEQKEPLLSFESKLQDMGHEIRYGRIASGLHGIAVMEDGLYGGADPRREGLAAGD